MFSHVSVPYFENQFYQCIIYIMKYLISVNKISSIYIPKQHLSQDPPLQVSSTSTFRNSLPIAHLEITHQCHYVYPKC
jgi:hypothetical protein